MLAWTIISSVKSSSLNPLLLGVPFLYALKTSEKNLMFLGGTRQ